MTGRAVAAACVALALAPAAASAHSTVQIQGPDILYTSEDAVSNNKLTVDETPTAIRFRDREADSGIQGPSNCTPGDQEGAIAYELTCPKTGLQRLTVDLGPNEDSMVANMLTIDVGGTGASGADNLKVNGAVDDLLAGDTGNDVLDGGDGTDDLRGDEGNDTLTGAAGNDTLQGGTGVDVLDAGEGDDTINAPDGSADRITCGGGTDTVRADTVDEVAADCEKVERTFIAPPSGQQAGEDKTKPVLKAGGSTAQRISMRRRLVRVAVSLSEVGEVSASGILFADGINTPVKTRSYEIDVAGGGVTILIKLTRRQVRMVLRDIERRGRRVFLRVNVVGSDEAGNSVVHPRLKIRLRK